MSGVYGFPSRAMTDLSSQLFKHEHLSKMLFYTDKQYETEDILSQKKVSWSKLKDKNIFIGRRIPIILKQSGAFISFRVYDYYPHNKQGMYNVEIDIDVIVHQDCMKTIHGTRDAVIMTMIHEALEDADLTGIGECSLLNTYDIRDLDAEYCGYTNKVRIVGMSKVNI